MNALREKYAAYLLTGLFRDTDGIAWDNRAVEAHVFEAADGSRAALCWNRAETAQTLTLTFEGGVSRTLTIAPQSLAVALDK